MKFRMSRFIIRRSETLELQAEFLLLRLRKLLKPAFLAHGRTLVREGV
jgi:hypothetical protein